ncbi:MAG: DnaJ C-terminal domain-containing protein [Deinococcales bacterium]
MAAYKDYYQTLGLSKDANKDDIRKAFRKLAAKYHPDKNPNDPKAEETFKEINEAYTVLSDEEKRRFYDAYGTTDGRPPFTGAAGGGFGFDPTQTDFSDFFKTLFGGGFGNRGTDFGGFRGYADPQPNRVEASLGVGLEQAFQGGSTTISVDGRRIEVNIPPGSQEGTKLRLRGQAPGGGDLYLNLKLEAHPHFQLDGDNIRVKVKVPDYVAVLGGPVRVPTLEGDVEMTLPEKTQSGRVLRLKGKGWLKRDGTRGDSFAEVVVTIPSSLSEAQRKLYEELRALDKAVQA